MKSLHITGVLPAGDPDRLALEDPALPTISSLCFEGDTHLRVLLRNSRIVWRSEIATAALEPVAELQYDAGAISFRELIHGGNVVLSHEYKVASAYDVASGALLSRFEHEGHGLVPLEGTTVLCRRDEGKRARLCGVDVSSGAELWSIGGEYQAEVFFTGGDGRVIVVSNGGFTVYSGRPPTPESSGACEPAIGALLRPSAALGPYVVAYAGERMICIDLRDGSERFRSLGYDACSLTLDADHKLFLLSESRRFNVVSMRDGVVVTEIELPYLPGESVVIACAHPDRQRFAVGTDLGRVFLLSV